jgi:hypothetical protein
LEGERNKEREKWSKREECIQDRWKAGSYGRKKEWIREKVVKSEGGSLERLHGSNNYLYLRGYKKDQSNQLITSIYIYVFTLVYIFPLTYKYKKNSVLDFL